MAYKNQASGRFAPSSQRKFQRNTKDIYEAKGIYAPAPQPNFEKTDLGVDEVKPIISNISNIPEIKNINDINKVIINSSKDVAGVKALTKLKKSINSSYNDALKLQKKYPKSESVKTVVDYLKGRMDYINSNTKGGSLVSNTTLDSISAKSGSKASNNLLGANIPDNDIKKSSQKVLDNVDQSNINNATYFNYEMMNKYGKKSFKELTEIQKDNIAKMNDSNRQGMTNVNEWIENRKNYLYENKSPRVNVANDNDYVDAYNAYDTSSLQKELDVAENEYNNYMTSKRADGRPANDDATSKPMKEKIESLKNQISQINRMRDGYKDYATYGRSNMEKWDSKYDAMSLKDVESAKASGLEGDYLEKYLANRLKNTESYEDLKYLKGKYEAVLDTGKFGDEEVDDPMMKWYEWDDYKDRYLRSKQQYNFDSLSKDYQDRLIDYAYNADDTTKSATSRTSEYNSIINDLKREGFTDNEVDSLVSYALSKRNENRAYFKNKKDVEFGREHPVSATISSIANSLASGIGMISTFASSVKNSNGFGGETPIDWYSSAHDISRTATSQREGVKQSVANAVGTIADKIGVDGGKAIGVSDFVYDTFASTLDSIATLPMNYIVPFSTLIILGGSAGEQSMLDAKNRGMSDADAIKTGVVSGLFEGLFEQLSLDKIASIVKAGQGVSGIKGVLTRGLTSMGIEGSEEVATEMANILYDSLANGEYSNYQQLINQYMSQGYTKEEAISKAHTDFAKQVVLAGVGGALGGGMHAGVFSAFNSLTSERGNKVEGQSIIDNGNADTIMEVGKSLDNDEIVTFASNLEQNGKYNARAISKLQKMEIRHLSNSISDTYQNVYDDVRTYALEKLEGLNYNVSDVSNAISKLITNTATQDDANVVLRDDALKTLYLDISDKYIDNENLNTVHNSVSLLSALQGMSTPTVQNLETEQNDITNAVNEDVVEETPQTIPVDDNGNINVEEAEKILTEFDEKLNSSNIGENAKKVISEAFDGNNMHRFLNETRLVNAIAKNSQFNSIEDIRRMAPSEVDYLGEELTFDIMKATKADMNTEYERDFKLARSDYKAKVKSKGNGTYKNFTDSVDANEEIHKRIASKLGINIIVSNNIDGSNLVRGKYDAETNTLYVNASKDKALSTVIHELMEYVKFNDRETYDIARLKLVEWSIKNEGVDAFDSRVVKYVDAYQKYGGREAEKTYNDAVDEVVNDAMSKAFKSVKGAEDFLQWLTNDETLTLEEKSKIQKLFARLMDLIYEGLRAFSDVTMSANEAKEIREMFFKGLDSSKAKMDSREILTQKDINKQISSNEGLRLNLETYLNGGREQLLKYLKGNKDIDSRDAEDMINELDSIADMAQKKFLNPEKYMMFSSWSSVDVVQVENSKGDIVPAFSVVVKNGEYPLNIDFSTVCKKRKALNSVLNALARDGILNVNTLTKTDIQDINDIIKKRGFEVACALCFVDSKRYNQGSWAQSFTNLYNEMVKSLVPEGTEIKSFNFLGAQNDSTNAIDLSDEKIKLDTSYLDKVMDEEYHAKYEKTERNHKEGEYKFLNKNGTIKKTSRGRLVEPTSERYKIAKEIKESANGDRKLLKAMSSSELMASEGLDIIKKDVPLLYSMLNRHGGTSKAKLSHTEVPSHNEIITNRSFRYDSAYKVGGVRIQSFSDYMANMFFDYFQTFAELSAKKLPLHAYTKEEDFVILFGKTGAKINMSLVPKGIIDSKLTKHEKELLAEYRKVNKRLDEIRIAKETYKKLGNKSFDANDFGAEESIKLMNLWKNGKLERIEYSSKEVKREAEGLIERLREIAGFDENGEFIMEDESFDMNRAFELRQREGYENCGTILVGITDKHIRKALKDNRIDMVIPYHKSGLNIRVAMARNIDVYKDYTDWQNTKSMSLNSIGNDKFNFYKAMEAKNATPKSVATKYYDYCMKRGMIPKFMNFYFDTDVNVGDIYLKFRRIANNSSVGEAFKEGMTFTEWMDKNSEAYENWAKENGSKALTPEEINTLYDMDAGNIKLEENYYKLLVDYRVYDNDGNYMRFADKNGKLRAQDYIHIDKSHLPSDSELQETIKRGLDKYEDINKNLNSDMKDIVNEIKGVLTAKNQRHSIDVLDDELFDSLIDLTDSESQYDDIEESITLENIKEFSAEVGFNLTSKEMRLLGIDFEDGEEISYNEYVEAQKEILNRMEELKRPINLKSVAMTTTNGVASYTPERLDYLYEYFSASNKDYAQAYITRIAPSEFLKLTTSTQESENKIRSESRKLDVENLRNNEQPIMLDINSETGEIYGHEGRHRMVALENAGINSVPVVLVDMSNKYSKKRGDVNKLLSQDFFSRHSDYSVSIQDAIPLNRVNDDLIRQEFVNKKSDVRFSLDIDSLQKQNQALLKQNKEYQRTIEGLRQQFKRTKGHKVGSKGINTLARYLKKQTNTKVGVQDIAKSLNQYFNLVYEKGNNIENSDVVNLGESIVRDLLEQSKDKETLTAEGQQILKDIKSFKFSLNDDQKKEIAIREGSYEKWRRSNIGRLTISNNAKNIDEVWGGLVNIYPELFKDINDKDKALVLSDVVKIVRENYTNDMGYDINEASTFYVAEMLTKYNELPEVQTWMDKHVMLKEEYNKYKKDSEKAIRELKREAEHNFKSRVRKAVSEGTKETIANIRAKEKEKYARAKMSRATTEERNKVKDLVKEINSMLINPTTKKHVPVGFQPVLIEFLDSIDVGQQYSEARYIKMIENIDAQLNDSTLTKEQRDILQGKRDRILILQGNFRQRVQDTFNAYYKLQKNSSDADKLFFNKALADKMEDFASTFSGTSIMDLSYDDTKELKNILRMIKTDINNYNRIIDYTIIGRDGKPMSIKKAVNQAIFEVKNGNSKNSNLFNKYVALHLRPDTLFNALGGYGKNNVMLQLGEMLKDAQRDKLKFEQISSELMRDLINDKEAETLQKYGDKHLVDIGIKDIDGNAVKLTRGMMISLYFHLQNEQNRKHIIEGGFTVPNYSGYYKGDYVKAYDGRMHQVTGIAVDLDKLDNQIQEAIDKGDFILADNLEDKRSDVYDTGLNKALDMQSEIEKQLTPYEKRLIDTLKVFFDDYSSKYLNEASMKRYGVELADVENYFPIHVNKAYLSSDAIYSSTDGEQNLGEAGFMKRRVDSKKPILLEDVLNVYTDQLNRTAKYYAYLVPQHNLNRMLGAQYEGYTKNLTMALQETYADGFEMLNRLKKDLFGGRTRTGGDVLSFLRGNMARTNLTMNLGVTIKQSASYPTAIARLGYTPLAKALAVGGKNNWAFSSADRELIAKYTPLLWYRNIGNGSMLEVAEAKNNSDVVTKVYNKIDKKTNGYILGWIQKMDIATVGRLWYASEYYVADNNPKLSKLRKKYGSTDKEFCANAPQEVQDLFFTEVAKVFNDVVEQTQPNYTLMQRAELQRNNNELMKILAMFKTQSIQNINILVNAIGEYNAYRKDFRFGKKNGTTAQDVKEKRKALIDAITSQFIAQSIFVGMGILATSVFRHRKPKEILDDNGNIDLTKFLEYYSIKMFQAQTGGFAMASQIETAIEAVVNKTYYYEMGFGGFDAIDDILANLVSTATATSDKQKIRYLKNAGYDLAQILGIPNRNAENLVKGFIGIYNDINDDGELNWSDDANKDK